MVSRERLAFELRESKRIEDCLLLKGQVSWSWKGNRTWRARGSGREESLRRQDRGGEDRAPGMPAPRTAGEAERSWVTVAAFQIPR